jgi:hypothetical protein
MRSLGREILVHDNVGEMRREEWREVGRGSRR